MLRNLILWSQIKYIIKGGIALKGQDLTEYALLLVFIAIIIFVAVMFFGNSISTFFSTLGNTVSSYMS